MFTYRYIFHHKWNSYSKKQFVELFWLICNFCFHFVPKLCNRLYYSRLESADLLLYSVFYRCRQNTATLNIILFIYNVSNLHLQNMTDVDKSGLIDDAFNLARGGYLSYNTVLTLTLYLDKEMQHLPWDSAYSAFTYITDMFEFGGDFATWRVSRYNKIYISNFC